MDSVDGMDMHSSEDEYMYYIYSSVDDRGMNTGITQWVEGTCSRVRVIINVLTVG